MATHDTRTNPSLPNDIIYIILSRLPVKSLLRFKTACRSWLSLISSRDFIKTHLNDAHYTHHHLLLWHRPKTYETCFVYSLLNEAFTKSMLDESDAQTFKLDHPGDHVKDVVGCCNGLVCLESIDKRRVFLWNPSTRKSRRLPEIDDVKFVHAEHRENGFCYDESKDDFKVISVFGYHLEYSYVHSYEVAVYSSKSDSWRVTGDFPCGYISDRGKFANGAVHWKVRKPNNLISEIWNIVSLDIETETYQNVMLPKYVEVEDCKWTFETFGENVILGVYQKTCSDYWVMKEYGVEECWRKLFTIPHDENVFKTMGIEMYPPYRPNPIFMFVNGDVLLNLYSTIVLYSTKLNTFKDLLNFRFTPVRSVFTYVESLVSP